MAGREKGGFWVGVTALFFYPFSWFARQRYTGIEKFPRTGGVLLVMNHVSHYDIPVDAVFVHRAKRIPRFLGKASVKDIPVLGKVLVNSGGFIQVHRGTPRAGEAYREANQALQDGKVVLIYPEGTITKDPNGWLKNSYTGVARLALNNDVPVLPVARWGSQFVLDGYAKKFRPFPRKAVQYNVGDPVDLSKYRGMEQTPPVLREVTEVIMAEVTELLAGIRGERPPPAPHKPAESDA